MLRSKILTCAAAVAMLAAPTLVSPASARGWGHGGWGGWGAGAAGFAAGALVGGALASRPYGYGYYDYDPGYVAVAPAPAPGGDAVGYCMQRYRSYDPGSGTFLGYDGVRHPCP